MANNILENRSRAFSLLHVENAEISQRLEISKHTPGRRAQTLGTRVYNASFLMRRGVFRGRGQVEKWRGNCMKLTPLCSTLPDNLRKSSPPHPLLTCC
jgi:hypothetical protein